MVLLLQKKATNIESNFSLHNILQEVSIPAKNIKNIIPILPKLKINDVLGSKIISLKKGDPIISPAKINPITTDIRNFLANKVNRKEVNTQTIKLIIKYIKSNIVFRL